MSPLCESIVSADRLDGAETFYPLHVRHLHRMPAGAAAGVRARRGHLLRLRLFLVVLGFVGGARQALRRRDDRSARPRTGTPRRRGGQQRRLPAAALRRRRRSRCSASSRPPTSPRWRASKGIRTEVEFLGARDRCGHRRHSTARPTWWPATTCTLTCLTCVGFTAGLAALVKPTGLVTLEFPHLLRLIERRQYDTIYHEHYQYLSLLTASRALATAGPGGRRRGRAGHPRRVAAGLRPTSRRGRRAVGECEGGARGGGSRRAAHGRRPRRLRRSSLRDQARPDRASCSRRGPGQPVVGYGAPGKGNTLLNHCGIRSDLWRTRWTAARTSRASSCRARTSRSTTRSASPADRPDFVLVLPWNLRAEIAEPARLHRRVGAANSYIPIPRAGGGAAREGGAVLRWPRDADARGQYQRAQTDEHDRRPAAAVARDAVLRALRSQGLHPLPGLRRGRGQGVLPALRRDASNDFTMLGGGREINMHSTDITDWNITFIDTGLASTIGERLMRVREYVAGRGDVPRQLRRHAHRCAARPR